jgi:ATP-dependent helicase/nuclease subunit B
LPTSATRLKEKIDDLAATLSRLSGRVTLSWPCSDLLDDRETLASGRRDADLESLNLAAGRPVSFAPGDPAQALDETEMWLWRLTGDDVRGTDQTRLVEARYPHLARGRQALRERFGGFGPFSGFVPQAGKDLDPFAAGGPALAASALETAGRCPLAFFFRSALGLYPLEEMADDLDRWLDPAQFGLLLHEVFRSFLAELAAADQRPQFDRDNQRLAAILQKAVTQWRSAAPPPNETAFRTQYWRLVRTAKIFLQAEEEFCKTSRPRFFEVSLGLEHAAEGSPLDDPSAVLTGLPSGAEIRAKGRIDRVDEIGAHQYAVWDYKIGSAYGYDRADPFRQGRRIQNALYVRMIEAALRAKVDPRAVVETFGYFFPGIRAHGLRVAWDAAELAAGGETLERLCALIAEGAFLATNKEEDCAFCDYRSICGDVKIVTSQSQELLEQNGVEALLRFQELRHG